MYFLKTAQEAQKAACFVLTYRTDIICFTIYYDTWEIVQNVLIMYYPDWHLVEHDEDMRGKCRINVSY